MSGESGGLVLLPLLAMGALPFVLGGLAVAGVAYAGVKAGQAAVHYEKNKRVERREIRQSDTGVSIGNFRGEMQRSMNQQNALNVQASNQMMKELERQRAAMHQAAQQQDVDSFGHYVRQMKQSHTQVMNAITGTQERFNQNYRSKITESMYEVTRQINDQYAERMNEIGQLKSDIAAKNKRASEIADGYISEATALLTSLEEDYNGRKFSSRQITALRTQLNQAVSLYNSGSYESAIAGAKDVATAALEEIFEADAAQKEWDNYYKLALVLSEEVKAFIESQETVTEAAKAHAEKYSGKTLENEIVGMRIADYTDRNSKGQTRYDYLCHRANETYNALRGEDAQNLTTEQLKATVDFLNNELYPAISICMNKAVANMNNAFSRQNISEDIIDFFEEHNFTFSGYAYDDNAHDKALHIGLENEATGEELIITLAPELIENGDVQTHIDLKQIKGDEANEERKAYYRECVENVVKGANPYAQCSLKCKGETRGKLSSDTETKKKLKK
ncbi:MAG: hypothetical protein IJM51_03080 [Clostridia bacterium]|nr:hypothetical protein [Clostridia bacterium]